MKNSSLKRMSGYGVAVATVLGSASAKAAINYVDINPDQTGTSNNPSVLLSFSLQGVVATDGSHVNGEQFYAAYDVFNPGPGNVYKLNFGTTNGVATFNSYPLAFGTLIGPGQPGDPTNSPPVASIAATFAAQKGPWFPGDRAYLGLKFDNGGIANYGWADITVNDLNSITLHSFAYEDNGNPIPAGAVVPEPSQIALFAIGAAGIAAYRRRKQFSTASR